MENNKLDEIFSYAIEVTKDCGAVLKEGYFGNFEVTLKDEKNNDLVTDYDGKIEKMFIESILKRYPDHKFIGEETSADSKFTPELTNDPTWIIDPIDGTCNFVHSFPETVISIALAINKEIVIGIIFNPIKNEFYSAKKGNGAFMNGLKIHTSNVTNIRNSLIGHEISLASYEHLREKNINRLRSVVSLCQGIRSIGCAAQALAYVAKGVLDAYHIDDLKPWDIAAGALIVKEAGGTILTPQGGSFDIMNPNIVAAGTETLCLQLIDVIKCYT